jgi:SAM-dependent methyltransferase
MNQKHEANRRYWDRMSDAWARLRDEDQLWRRCPYEPELAFEGEALAFIRQVLGDLSRKRALVVGSGDNYAAFALAGMGARVTSTDISAGQLSVAEARARQLGLEIALEQCDAADLAPLPAADFDLACSTNGFFVWIADLAAVFAALHRVLAPGGFYVFYDVHPYQRPWKDQVTPLAMDKSYGDRGPYVEGEPGGETYEFHWTLGDLLNGLAGAGFVLRQIGESPAEDARFWESHSYRPGADSGLQDWRQNPRAGLPVWLTVAAQKPT